MPERRRRFSPQFKAEAVQMVLETGRSIAEVARDLGVHDRTLLDEWAYARPYRSETERRASLPAWLHYYNHHRHHTALGGPPASRVPNLSGQNT